MRRHLRAAVRLARLGGVIGLARWEARRGLATRRDRAVWQQRQARRMLAALGVRHSVTGSLPSGGLVVSNHLGYLDVLVIAAQGPSVFVSKAEVRGWPLIGALLEAAGTILAHRDRAMSAGRTGEEIRGALLDGLPVVLFPEGTSSDGSSVLPLKPSLLQAALDTGSPITPAAISYHTEDGTAGTDICYWGDAVFPKHIAKLASLEDAAARLRLGEAGAPPGNRKAAALSLHAVISGMLAELKAAPR